MAAQKERRGPYTISTDQTRLDIETIHAYLSNRSYWAQGRSLAVVRTSVEHSLCFGVYEGEQQVGFARVVTDHTTFGWLCDVFIIESHQGRGLGKRLIEAIVNHPQLAELSIFILATRDAHELYSRYGAFQPLAAPEKWMIRRQ